MNLISSPLALQPAMARAISYSLMLLIAAVSGLDAPRLARRGLLAQSYSLRQTQQCGHRRPARGRVGRPRSCSHLCGNQPVCRGPDILYHSGSRAADESARRHRTRRLRRFTRTLDFRTGQNGKIRQGRRRQFMGAKKNTSGAARETSRDHGRKSGKVLAQARFHEKKRRSPCSAGQRRVVDAPTLARRRRLSTRRVCIEYHLTFYFDNSGRWARGVAALCFRVRERGPTALVLEGHPAPAARSRDTTSKCPRCG